MANQIFDAFKNQPANLFGPSRELNKLAVAKLEQLVRLQLASLREYSDLNLEQLKAATDINDAAGLKDYFAKQRDYLKTIGEKLVADAQAMAALGKEFTQEAQKLATKGVAEPGKDIE